MALITLENASFGYDTGIILKNINFFVECGDYLSIVGENGSGKSTLMKGLTGLIKPKTGTIKFENVDKIGYLPQQTIIQRDFPASVREVVLSGCVGKMGFRPFYTKSEKANAEHCMELMSIVNLKNKSYRELSGGQQQRVLLARALCATDNILLLDEPTAGLDPLVTLELYELIVHLNHSHHVTVIMVSHDIDAAIKYSNKILHLKDTVKFFGTTDEYIQSDAHSLLDRRNGDA